MPLIDDPQYPLLVIPRVPHSKFDDDPPRYRLMGAIWEVIIMPQLLRVLTGGIVMDKVTTNPLVFFGTEET